MRKVIWLTLACVVIFSANAPAQSPMNALQAASDAYRNGEFTESINQLKEAIEGVWNEAPLSVANLHYITNEPQGFGDFRPRANNVFTSLEPVRVYCEIVGPVAKKTGHVYHTALSYDFSVVTSDGQAIGGQQGLKAFESESSFFSPEVMMYLTLNFKGLGPGDYTLHITLHDKNSSKTTSLQLPLVIQ